VSTMEPPALAHRPHVLMGTIVLTHDTDRVNAAMIREWFYQVHGPEHGAGHDPAGGWADTAASYY
jgi:hypothetical protein